MNFDQNIEFFMISSYLKFLMENSLRIRGCKKRCRLSQLCQCSSQDSIHHLRGRTPVGCLQDKFQYRDQVTFKKFHLRGTKPKSPSDQNKNDTLKTEQINEEQGQWLWGLLKEKNFTSEEIEEIIKSIDQMKQIKDLRYSELSSFGAKLRARNIRHSDKPQHYQKNNDQHMLKKVNKKLLEINLNRFRQYYRQGHQSKPSPQLLNTPTAINEFPKNKIKEKRRKDLPKHQRNGSCNMLGLSNKTYKFTNRVERNTTKDPISTMIKQSQHEIWMRIRHQMEYNWQK